MAGAGDTPELERRGRGASLLLIHGSAADRSTWQIQMASLSDRFELAAYDRTASLRSIEAEAAEAARAAGPLGPPVVVCGSSFGGVVALELARSRPELVAGAILCEPPLPAADALPAVPAGFGCRFDRVAAERGGEAAAEMFLRSVLTDAAFERIPELFRRRSRAKWRQIRDDSVALARYRVGYDRLAAVRTPFLLLAGERSAPGYRDTLEALAEALPTSAFETVAGAGHMMHANAHRRFNAAVDRFCARIGHR